jgi:hypothetical protein
VLASVGDHPFSLDWIRQAGKMSRQAATFDEARAAAKEFQGKPLTNLATHMEAVVSRNRLDKMLSEKAVGKSVAPAVHSLAVANLDTLFERAILGWSKPDANRDINIRAIHRFFVPMVLENGRAVLVKLTVKETIDLTHKNPLYTVEAVEFNEKSPAAQWVGDAAKLDGIPETTRSVGDVQSLAERVQDFNRDTKTTTSGHAQPLTAKVLTTQGYKSMGEINIGDEVVTIDGSATKVSGIYPQGEQDIFRVQLSDGGVTRTTADHIWLVRPEGAANFREMTLAEMMPEIAKGRRFELPLLQEAA